MALKWWMSKKWKGNPSLFRKGIGPVHFRVSGEIDWNRRFDHMQQHAGQHILSAAFEELYGYKTVSFHLGKETLTIDLEISELPVRHAEEAERLANSIILENRPIEARWVSAEEASQFPLRKQLVCQ